MSPSHEYILETIKEIFNFIFNLIMVLICTVIIIYGSWAINLEVLGFFPFLYFIVTFMNRVSKVVEQKDNLENSLAYYKNRAEKYEKILSDAIHKESL